MIDALNSNNVILFGEVGSHAYGLNHENSDHDYLGVFQAPTLEVAGLLWSTRDETKTDTSPDNTQDWTLHEVGKLVRLALKANPTVTELLWLDTGAIGDWSIMTQTGTMLVNNRHLFLSESYVRSAYRGYAFSQLEKFVLNENFKLKHARHCLRIIQQGLAALETGLVRVAVEDPQVFFDMANMSHQRIIDTLRAELDKFDDVQTTPLRAEPDVDAAAQLLTDIRCTFM